MASQPKGEGQICINPVNHGDTSDEAVKKFLLC